MRLRSTPVHPVTLISARIDRAITPGEARFLDAHMPSCESCQRKDAELRAICGMLEAHSVATPPPFAVERLMDRLQEVEIPQADDTEPVTVSSVPRKPVRPWMLILPAILILIVAGVLIGRQRRSIPPVLDPPPAESQSFPTSMPESPAQTCASSSAAPAIRPVEQLEVSDPPPRPAPPPAAAVAVAVEIPAALPETVQPAAETQDEPSASAPPIFATSSIYFGGNGKRLNKEARRIIADMAEWMRDRPEIQLRIEARTDPRKSSKKTMELGRKRTLAVSRQFEAQGIDPSRLRQVDHDGTAPPWLDEDDDRQTKRDRVDLVPEL